MRRDSFRFIATESSTMPKRLLLPVLAVLLLPLTAAASFEVERIADGVYVARRTEPPGLMVDANSVFIVNEQDVVVVDANVGPSSAKEVLAALRKITAKPVRYVVNTHWHDDHVLGNQIYRDAFPGVEFIGHKTMGEYLPTQGLKNRQNMLAGAPSGVAMLKSLLEKSQGMDGKPLAAETRASYESDIRLVERYLAETPRVEIVAPTITFEDRFTLKRGARTIDVVHLGRGHTAGDIVVHLRKENSEENIVVTGDLVVWPVPLIGGPQSYVTEWGGTLRKLLALKPAVIVPGHGPVMRDDVYANKMIALMDAIKEQVGAAKSRGESVETARKNLKLDEHRREFAGDNQVRNVLFSQYVVGPGVAAVYRELGN
jgi:cyclase